MGSYFKMAMLFTITCSAATSGVQAHPGSKILTTGSGDRTAMTDGMTYEDVKGVHIFRGRAAKVSKAHSASKVLVRKEIDIDISLHPAFRRFRHLRTQGFFSGVAYPSRRYTHGFFSDH